MKLTEAEALELLGRMAARDQAAIRELHRRIAKRIYAFALNRLHDHHEAESVVSEVLHQIWLQPGRFNGACQFMTWVLGIARYKILHELRHRAPVGEEVDESIPDNALDASEQLAGKELRELLLAAMDRLSPNHREVLHLMYFEDMTVNEVAEIQRCPVGTVKTRLLHARRHMRGLLDPVADRGDRGERGGRAALPVGPRPAHL